MPRPVIKIRIAAFLPSLFTLVAAACPVVWASEPPGPKSAPLSADSDSAALSSLSLEQLMEVPVVITASRFEQPISDAPSAVVVLTAQDIKDFGWRTLADALASLPGLYVSNDRNYSYLGARGFLRPGDYDSRFLLMIDGYRTNDAVYDEATIGTEGLVDMDLVERIEYVPGPGSAVYGSNAFFGVVNVITKKGSAINGAETAVAAGSYGEKKARATYGWHGENGADIVLSATSYIRNGQDLYYPEFNTPDQNGGVAHGLDYDRAQSFFAKATYGEFTVSAAHSNRTKGVPTASFGAVFNTPNSTNDAQSFINGVFAHEINSGLAVAVQAYWGRYDYTGVGIYPGDPPRTNVDGDRALWYGGDAHVTVTSLAKNRIVAGLDFQRDARRDQYNYDLNPYTSELDDKRSSNRAGAYVEDEIQLPANFALNAGLRYDWDSVASGNVNPRLALIYKLTAQDTAKLIYGTAYRAPNAFELYYAVPGNGGQLPNPNLKPEHITTTEFIFEHAFSHSGSATLSLFQYSVRNLISLETDPASGLLIYQNVDRAKATGLELAAERSFGEGFRIRASYSWQLAKDGRTDAPLQNSPRHLVKLNAVAPLFHNAARFGTEMQCVSSRLAEDSTAGGYCLANFTVSSSHLIPRATVSLSIYNAFNKRYADPAGPAFVQETIEQQSRTFYAKLIYGF
ncbi:TonB-dependent receptor plug domain-containing protein [Paraburkholderia aspalathi]|nr:TonB-dependent receptor [Paraburkholderia aspalathi]MBK3822697.1 TonB-dependent receptor [Paraburkholderia aspalathi]MBK3834504.1 TonB-dependent receptor [Paraburkholderia aspalathi]MBK3864255.1 TonB-dependent receptor [Paraburkholderia aspalathi]